MADYLVEYYKKCLMNTSPPHGPYKFRVSASSLEEAARIATPELLRVGFSSDLHDIWDAAIIGPKHEYYEILKGGGWLIDDAGQLKGSLERKL